MASAAELPDCVAAVKPPDRLPPEQDDDWTPDPVAARRLVSEAEEAFEALQWRAALRLVERAMESDNETNPAGRPYYALRAACLEKLREPGPAAAIELYNEGLEATARGDFAAARQMYDEALNADPGLLWAANNRAWLGATHPDPAARNDADAVAYATYACVKSRWRDWSLIDTLAAALAEAGRFVDAERCAERARRLAPADRRAEVEAAIVAYRAGRPFRQDEPRGDGAEAVGFALPEPEGRNSDVADGVLVRLTVDELARIMAREGYTTNRGEDNFLSWKIDGYKTQVFIVNDGQSLQFHSSFSDTGVDLGVVNEWNRTKRYSTSYLDDDGDPHIELDLDLAGGITELRLIDFLDTSRLSFLRWVKEVVNRE